MTCVNGRTGSGPQLQTKARAIRVTMLMMISAFDIFANIGDSCAKKQHGATYKDFGPSSELSG